MRQTPSAAERLRSIKRDAIWIGAIWFIYGIGLVICSWLDLYKPTIGDGAFWAGLGIFAALSQGIVNCTEAIFQKIQEAVDTKRWDAVSRS